MGTVPRLCVKKDRGSPAKKCAREPRNRQSDGLIRLEFGFIFHDFDVIGSLLNVTVNQ